MSEVPLGAFLSGGIDSSAVVALMSEVSSEPVKTFSIGFEEQDFSELHHARRVAEHVGADHHEFIVRPDAMEVLPMLVEHYGEPYADSSAIPTYYVARETRKHVTVALNGDGGDESFAGYERYAAMQLGGKVSPHPGDATRVGRPTSNWPDSVFGDETQPSQRCAAFSREQRRCRRLNVTCAGSASLTQSAKRDSIRTISGMKRRTSPQTTSLIPGLLAQTVRE